MTVTLHKLRLGDEHFLYHLMTSDQEIIEASLKSDFSKWQKMVEWAVRNPDDLFWKIKINDESSLDVDCGYIGFTSTKGKISLDSIRSKLTDDLNNINLVLEIYILKEYRGRDIGKIAYHQAIEKIREFYRRKTLHIYASTYMTNLKAQRFFADALGMSLSHYFSHISVVFVDEHRPLG